MGAPSGLESARVTPHSPEAERAVLSAILLDNAAYAVAASMVSPADFFDSRYRVIFECCRDLIRDGQTAATIVTVTERLQSNQALERVDGGAATIAALVDGPAVYTNAVEYVASHAQVIAEKSRLRKLASEARRIYEIAHLGTESSTEITAELRASLDALHLSPSDAVAVRQSYFIEQETDRERARVEARRRVAAENTATAVVKPNPISLDELLGRDFPPLEYAIDQLQPKGAKVLFAAQAKAGKTTTVINLIRSLVDGELFLSSFRPAPLQGRVCLIDLEMTDRQMHHWFTKVNIRNRSRVTVQQLRGKVASFNILDPVVRSEWAAKLRELEISYLFFDNLRPLMDALGLDENSDAGRLLVAFDALVAEAGVSESMIVHHMGHNGNRSRGDSRLRDWPDVEWMLTREKDDKGEVADMASPRYFRAYGRDCDVPLSQLAFDETSRRLTLVGGSPAQAKSDAALSAVYELVADGPLAKSALESAMGVRGFPRPQARAAIDRGLQQHVLQLEIVGKQKAHMITRGHIQPPAVARRGSPWLADEVPNSGSPLAAPYRGGRASDSAEGVSGSPEDGGGPKAVLYEGGRAIGRVSL